MSLTYEDFGGFDRLHDMAHRIVPVGLHRDMDDPAQHAPKYHEHSLLRHLQLVCEAAERIVEATSVDVRLAAVLHDVAKLHMFPRVARGANEARVHGTIATYMFHYIGHEPDSADIAHDEDADDETCWLVAYHAASYQRNLFPPKALVSFCKGDRELVAKLMAICASDAAGKGWVTAQTAQRSDIADRFAQVASLAGIDPTFATTIDNALRKW